MLPRLGWEQHKVSWTGLGILQSFLYWVGNITMFPGLAWEHHKVSYTGLGTSQCFLDWVKTSQSFLDWVGNMSISYWSMESWWYAGNMAGKFYNYTVNICTIALEVEEGLKPLNHFFSLYATWLPLYQMTPANCWTVVPVSLLRHVFVCFVLFCFFEITKKVTGLSKQLICFTESLFALSILLRKVKLLICSLSILHVLSSLNSPTSTLQVDVRCRCPVKNFKLLQKFLQFKFLLILPYLWYKNAWTSHILFEVSSVILRKYYRFQLLNTKIVAMQYVRH